MVATSLSTIVEDVPPYIIEKPLTSPSSLSKQIVHDVNTLLGSVQTVCTNLTLALKPEANTTGGNGNDKSRTLTTGLSESSLEAANAQMVTLMNEVIPKLVWLARKAASEAKAYIFVQKTCEELEQERAEREFVQAKGGSIVRAPHARELEKLDQAVGSGLGDTWAKRIRNTTFEVVEAIGNLSDAFMDEHTRKVMDHASKARSKAENAVAVNSRQSTAHAKSVKEAREDALRCVAKVWEICDSVLKGGHKLAKDNREAVMESWKGRIEILKDAVQELKDALAEEREDDENVDIGFDGDHDDILDSLKSLKLSAEEKQRAQNHLSALTSACKLHGTIGKILFDKSTESCRDIDFDGMEQRAEDFSSATDELVSSLLYGIEDSSDRNSSLHQDQEEVASAEEEEAGDAVGAFLSATEGLYHAIQAQAQVFRNQAVFESLEGQMQNVSIAIDKLKNS